MFENTCSKCNLCCTFLEVSELSKPIGTKCIYNIDGCSIYNKRPLSCQKFKCAWLQYNLNYKLRPDNCRVIFERLFTNPIYVALVDPEYPDSWRTGIVLKLIYEMLQTNHAIVIKIGNKLEEIFVPKGQSKENVLNSIKLFLEIIRGRNNGCSIIHNGSNINT